MKLDQITLAFEWTIFRAVNSTFDLRLLIDFKFKKYQFDVFSRLFNPTIDEAPESIHLMTSVYKTEYDHAQIHEINYQLANKVYDFIAAKVAEADTPPA